MSTQSHVSQAGAAAAQAPASHVRGDKLLRRTLAANSIFSALSGLLLALNAGAIAAFMGVASTLLFVVLGLVLLLFATDVFWVATRPVLPRAAVRGIFWLDVAWVVGSALILATDAFGLSSGGRWAIAGVADAVLVFAMLEFIGLRRLQ